MEWSKNVIDQIPATLVSEPSRTSISSEELLFATGLYDALVDIFHMKGLHVGANRQHSVIGPDLSHNLTGTATSSVCRLELINMPDLHS